MALSLEHLLKTLRHSLFYKQIGMGLLRCHNIYIVAGIHTHCLIAYTTPIPILVLSIMFFCFNLFILFKKNILPFSYFVVFNPYLRASFQTQLYMVELGN